MVTAVHPRTTHHRDPVLFRPTHVAVSRGAHAALELADCGLRPLLERHSRGDWGLLQSADARENEWAVNHGAPVRSLFELSTGARLLLETDATRWVTSILLDGGDLIEPPTLAGTAPGVGDLVAQSPSPDSSLTATSPVIRPPASLFEIVPHAYLDCCDSGTERRSDSPGSFPPVVSDARPYSGPFPLFRAAAPVPVALPRRIPMHASFPTHAGTQRTCRDQNHAPMPIDHLRLRRLYSICATARAFFDHAAGRTNTQRETKTDRIAQILTRAGHRAIRSELVIVFRELEACGCGRYIVGRRGHRSRFAWSVSMIECARVAAGQREPDFAHDEHVSDRILDATTCNPATPLREHLVPLRPNLTLTLQLPENLTREDCRRVVCFVRSQIRRKVQRRRSSFRSPRSSRDQPVCASLPSSPDAS